MILSKQLLCLFIVYSHFVSISSTVYVFHNVPFGAIVSSYVDAVAQFGPEVFQLNAYLVIARPLHACDELEPAPSTNITTGPSNTTLILPPSLPYIVLIRRGDCDFDFKVLNAQNAGYSGAIIFNTVSDEIFSMGGKKYAYQIEIPAVMVDKKAGLGLINFSISAHGKEYLINLVSFYNLPLKYVLISLLIVVGVSIIILLVSFMIHLCRLWRRARRGRLSRRHLRQLVIKRFTKGQDTYETCSICLEDFVDKDKLRLLPCQHAFHMQCIDPWLLRNRRRCPICNQTVELPGVPSVIELTNSSVDLDQSSINFIRRSFQSMFHRLGRSPNRNENRIIESQTSSSTSLAPSPPNSVVNPTYDGDEELLDNNTAPVSAATVSYSPNVPPTDSYNCKSDAYLEQSARNIAMVNEQSTSTLSNGFTRTEHFIENDAIDSHSVRFNSNQRQCNQPNDDIPSTTESSHANDNDDAPLLTDVILSRS